MLSQSNFELLLLFEEMGCRNMAEAVVDRKKSKRTGAAILIVIEAFKRLSASLFVALMMRIIRMRAKKSGSMMIVQKKVDESCRREEGFCFTSNLFSIEA